MPKSPNQKMKLLYLMKIFIENTDEQHVISINSIIEKLNAYGVNAERKSLYDDIECLRLFGMDILNRREAPAGYYLASREFELPELKLLVDSVQASKFITPKKSAQLIKKLESLTSTYEATCLQRQVYVLNRTKTINEGIYYNVDKIHSAIAANTMISFKYLEWTLSKTMQPRHNGELYNVSPYALLWDDENYYLVGYNDKTQSIRHYRVDKMSEIELADNQRFIPEFFKSFDTAQYSKKTFGMFGGQESNVKLMCSNNMIGVIIDRFGTDVIIHPKDDESFTTSVNVAVSPQFFGWLAGLDGNVRIVSPQSVVGQYKEYLQKLLSQSVL